mgnify:CR=1 FL=1
MRILLITLLLTACSAQADCPDFDGDGDVNACYDHENKFIPSADNCPATYNPDQKYPYRWQYVEEVGTFLFVKDKSTGGVLCNFDLYKDGQFTITDLGDLYRKIANRDLFPAKKGMIGDYNLNGRYDNVDYCLLQEAASQAHIYPGAHDRHCDELEVR